MRNLIVTAVLIAGTLAIPRVVRSFAQSSNAPAAAACGFALATTAPAPIVVGPGDVTSKVRFISQPDSPVAVSKLELDPSTLTIGGGTFMLTKNYMVEVVNRSDRPVSNVQLVVTVRTKHGGAGGGPMVKGSLNPGERRLVSLRSSGRGRASGTAPDDEAWLLVGVDSVEVGECTYRPSQALPVFGRPLQ
jgi:hypothetical protein